MFASDSVKTNGPLDLAPSERDAVELASDESLARQSVTSIFSHWALVAVLLGTTSLAADHPWGAAMLGSWMVIVGTERLLVARSFASLYASKPALWSRLFRLGLGLSSATWGIGGAALVMVAGFHQDSWLLLMCLAGVSAAGLISLCANRAHLRLHMAFLLLPMFAAGFFLPGSTRHVAGFVLIVAAYGGFLWVQGGAAHAAFFQAQVGTKLLERQAAELEAAREESVEASRVKSEFLANMSHEIRTPMTAVIGYADLLLDPSLGASDRVNHLQTIRRNGEHLLTVINDILDVSKIEAGKMMVERIPTSPSQLLVDVASLMRVRASAKNLGFEVKYQGAIPETIVSDPTRLKQIVMNFVGNSIKFTESGTVRILVRCDHPESPEPKLVIDVTDTGIGMTEGQMQKLFSSFSQADASTTRRFGGSGLGLLISKRLAELLGGEVSVESAPGRGSVFRVSIPTGSLLGVPMIEGLVEAGVVDTPAQSVRRVASLAPSCRVLLAEDGYDNQVLVTTYLVKAGATVKVVGDGSLAVEAATAALAAGEPYDVILMDMQMPVLDGYAATSKLRLMGYDRPIVALTAHAMAGDRERCEKAGCDEYLSKPIDRAKLVSLVARFTGGHGIRERLVSTLEHDGDMKEIVLQFMRDLPDRSSAILRASEASDVETLKRLAHQLKGAAGGYGFPGITDAASAVEQAIADGVGARLLQHYVEELASLCRRARAA
jgi:signal transduction histidine kinase/CheY-like chemotaxis protein/HPt (histidine-containing phosphotransfer) domain-containing protein